MLSRVQEMTVTAHFSARKAAACSHSRSPEQSKAKVKRIYIYVTHFRVTPGAVNVLRSSSSAPWTSFKHLHYNKSNSRIFEPPTWMLIRLRKFSVYKQLIFVQLIPKYLRPPRNVVEILLIGVVTNQSCSSTEKAVVESALIFVHIMSKYNKFTSPSVSRDQMPVCISTRTRSWLKNYVFNDMTDDFIRFKYRHLSKFTSQIDLVVVRLQSNSKLVPSESRQSILAPL